MPSAGTPAPNHSVLASRFLESRQWERALDAARNWLAEEPENSYAHLSTAQALVNLDRCGEAEPHLAMVLAATPENGFAHRLMSIICFQNGRFKEADEAVRMAIALNPNDGFHWYHLARMCYRQGDLATARTCVAKARQLQPRDADVANLAALCEPESAGTRNEAKLQQYFAALELDPESAVVYNNIGAHHLNTGTDYAAAEEFFRRALSLDPRNELFRSNLFLTLKRRDPIYRVLRAPRDGLASALSYLRRLRQGNVLLFILLLPVWLVGLRFIAAGLFLWFVLVWPLLQVYERLTVGDIRAKAGEFGARHGGFLGIRSWPLRVRLGLFALALVAFWSCLFFGNPIVYGLFALAGCAVGLIWTVRTVGRSWKRRRDQTHARRRSEALRELLKPEEQRQPAPVLSKRTPPPLPRAQP